MSNYTVVQDTTLELRRRIHEALTTAPDADLGLGAAERAITLSPPQDNLADAVRLSLFLYRVELDSYLRNQPHLPDAQTGQRYPPLPLQLHYLVTPLDDEEDQNQLMLGRIMQHFHDAPVVDSLNGVPLDDSHGGSSAQLRVTLETLSMEQLMQLWGALGTDYRLAVSYVVRVVAIDSAQSVTEARRVVEAHAAVGLME